MKAKNNPQKSRSVGALGEACAVRYLRLHGYTVKARNYRAGHHEIDVVAARLGVIAFVEVKARSYRAEELDTAPPPRTAVHAEKQRFTRQAARQYLREHPTNQKPRMDVIEIWFSADNGRRKPKILKIHHMKGAY